MLRAVFYARCSTEEESQKDALTQQVKEAKACIKDQGWTLEDRYIESKSGTTTKGRYLHRTEVLHDRRQPDYWNQSHPCRRLQPGVV